jgi:hypothetical protein
MGRPSSRRRPRSGAAIRLPTTVRRTRIPPADRDGRPAQGQRRPVIRRWATPPPGPHACAVRGVGIVSQQRRGSRPFGRPEQPCPTSRATASPYPSCRYRDEGVAVLSTQATDLHIPPTPATSDVPFNVRSNVRSTLGGHDEGAGNQRRSQEPRRLVDAVIDDAEECIIPRGGGRAVVMVSLDECPACRLHGSAVAAFSLSRPRTRAHSMRAIALHQGPMVRMQDQSGPDATPCEPPDHRHRRSIAGAFSQLTPQPGNHVSATAGRLINNRACRNASRGTDRHRPACWRASSGLPLRCHRFDPLDWAR